MVAGATFAENLGDSVSRKVAFFMLVPYKLRRPGGKRKDGSSFASSWSDMLGSCPDMFGPCSNRPRILYMTLHAWDLCHKS